MAVIGPIRAVLKAHGQATWNRSVRELGKSGTWVIVLVMGLAILFGAVPLGVLGVAGGWYCGLQLDRPGAQALLGLILLVIPVVGGTVSGVMGGTKALSWESYRVYPLKTRELFLAELAAGLGDPLPMLAAITLLGTSAGFAAARPALALAFLMICVGSMLAMLLIKHLVGALGAVLVKRLQLALVVLGVLVWSGSVFAGLGGKAKKPGGRNSLDSAQVALVKRTVQRTVEVLAWAPTTQALHGLEEIRQGEPWRGGARQIPALLLLGIVGWAAARVLVWESGSEVLKVQADKGARENLWTFSSPALGIARLTWGSLLGSHLGRFGFLIPLMTIVIIKGPAASIGGGGFWALPSAFAYLALTSGQLQFNQFGLDGHGVKALLLLPISGRDLLVGKLLGMALYQGVQALILVLLMAIVLRPTPLDLLSGFCLAGCFFLLQSLAGHWTSVWMARPLARDSLKNNGMPMLTVAASLGTTLANSLVFGGTWGLCIAFAPGLLLPVMAGLLILSAMLYAALLPSAVRFLDTHRERLLLALS